MMKKYLPLLFLIIFVGCTKNDKFTVTGKLVNGENKTLYFERNGLMTDSLIDSLVLKSEGNFAFKVKRAVYPELYRLRIDNQYLILGIDSTEIIEIKGDVNNLIECEITNSKPSVEIQQLRKSLRGLQQQLSLISNKNNEQENKRLTDSLMTNIEQHKKTVRDLVLTNQLSMSAYFGLFQQLSGEYIFSPYRTDDLPYFQAVATGFDSYMPNYERSKNLYQLVISALSEKRKAKKLSKMNFLEKANKTGFIDLSLKDKNGYPKKISDLLGNVILVDFSTFESETKIEHIFGLRKLHNNYANKGLKIYQVGIGKSKGIWQQSVATLPWVCVWDEFGKAVQIYNIQKLPTLFLISKEGNLIGRYSSTDEVSRALSSQL